jgi:indolepyruvate ferredoxin oxidoreductase alpha subunit
VAGDIGCYTLGAAAPLSALDSCVCMGGGFTVAMGMAKAFERSGVKDKKVFGIMGDSTFFHSGMTGAAEIIYNKGEVIPVVLDNSITGMTGHQDNPGSGYTLQGDVAERIRIEDVLASIGYEKVIIVDPQDLRAMEKAVEEAMASGGYHNPPSLRADKEDKARYRVVRGGCAKVHRLQNVPKGRLPCRHGA